MQLEDITQLSLSEWIIYLFWGVFGFFQPKELFSFYNLLFPLFFSFVLYGYYRKTTGDTQTTLRHYLFPKKVWLSASVRLDALYYVPIKALGIIFVFPLMAYGLAWISSGVTELLTALLGNSPALQHPKPDIYLQILYTTLVFIGIDFGFFFSHYLSHKYRFLWAFHKVHHSAEQLVPFTAHRFHPFDVGWNIGFSMAFSGLIAGICQYTFYNETSLYLLMGNNFVIALSYVTTHNFRHSHIWFNYPEWLNWLFIAPAQHQIHHSLEPRHIDKNFGYLLTCWDRWFDTLYTPRGQEYFEVGIRGLPESGIHSHKTVLSLLIGPILEAWDILCHPSRYSSLPLARKKG